jgi:hypothetical protein
MIGLGLGTNRIYRSGGGSQFDTNYQAVLNQASTLGYTAPSAAQQTLQNTLVTDLKTAGVWSKLDALYIMANDGSSDFGRLNWASPSAFELTNINSPTFTSNQGFTGDASQSVAIDTGIIMDTDTTNFSIANGEGSFGGWSYYQKTPGGEALMGTDDTTNDMRGGSNDYIMGLKPGSANLISGLYHINIKPSGANSLAEQFQNGVYAAQSPGSRNMTTYNGSMRLLSEDDWAYSNDTISIAFIGGDLSAEASDLYNAFAAYMAAL